MDEEQQMGEQPPQEGQTSEPTEVEQTSFTQPPASNNKLIIGIMIAFVLVAGSVGAYFFVNQQSDTGPVACTAEAKVCPDGSSVGRTGPNCEFAQCPGILDVQEYFNEKLREGVLDRVGQPIEGFIPQMFMQAFSGIVPKDFDGADAQLGSYTITDKELVFIVDDVNPIHSAADVLTEEGMKTVLANIQRRADTSITTTDEIDGLLLFLGAPFDPKVTECLPEQRDVDACIEIFQPVCATVNVQCVTTPCEPVLETFANSCKACSNSLVSSYTESECSIER